jgi:hypothetical protein
MTEMGGERQRGIAERRPEPQALDTIGWNLATRTSQMLHRKRPSRTPKKPPEMAAERMRNAGAVPEQIAAATEKVEVARDVRAVAVSTAKGAPLFFAQLHAGRIAVRELNAGIFKRLAHQMQR